MVYSKELQEVYENPQTHSHTYEYRVAQNSANLKYSLVLTGMFGFKPDSFQIFTCILRRITFRTEFYTEQGGGSLFEQFL
jgi:hypothetical protein